MSFYISRISKAFLPTVAASFLAAFSSGASGAAPAVTTAGTTPEIAQKLRKIGAAPVPFVANGGEIDPRVAYYARTFAGTVFVTKEGSLVYSLEARGAAKGAGTPGGWTLSESFPSATSVVPSGSKPSGVRISRFKPSTIGHSELSTFDEVSLGEIAPGVHALLRATGNNVEKLFTVSPGSDAVRIRARIGGAERLALQADGSLAIGTALGDVVFTAPVAWQDRAGKRIDVEARYVLAGNSEYGFALGAHDASLPVVIDPLIRSTFSGGGAADAIRAIAIHPGTGNVYAAGFTSSTNFPGTINGAQPTGNGTSEALVAHYTSDLRTLLRASYYGGDGADIASSIAIHPSTGDIYIAGTTTSNTGTLLNSAGSYGGGIDGFIARFDGALNSVLSARYFGGSGNDSIAGLAVDAVSGDVVIAGDTTSSNLALGAAGNAQLSNAGGQDAFAARFSSNLAALLRATYFGGSGSDRALALALDPITGDVIIGGSTTSPTLPVVANGAEPTNGGGSADGFIARLDRNLTTIRMSTYFGGSDLDTINALAVHPITGEIYAAGDTRSLNIRGAAGAQRTLGGGADGFVARFHGDLTGLRGFTYFGGLGDDFVNAIAISKYTGEIYIAGYSNSSTLSGTAGGIQEANAGGFDAFVARFDVALSAVRQSTFLGGATTDIAHAVALTDTGAYIGGETGSPTFPGAVAGSAQAAPAGGLSDGVLAAMSADLRLGNSSPAPFALVPVTKALPGTLQVSAPTKVTPTGDAIVYVDGQPGSSWCASTGPNCSCDKTGSVYQTGALQVTTTAPNPYYVCVRHTASAAPDAVTESRLHIGAVTGIFRAATGGGADLIGCTLDVDGNGTQDALTDGLLILRTLFGLSGTAVTNGAIGSNATRTSWTDIRAYLNSNCASTIP